MIPTSIKNIGYILAAIMGIKYQMLEAFAFLLIIDVITGVIASVVSRGKASFQSWTLARGIAVKAFYFLILLSIAYFGRSLEIEVTSFIKSSIAILATAELYSITANVYTIKTKKVVEEIDALTPIISKVKKMFDVVVGK